MDSALDQTLPLTPDLAIGPGQTVSGLRTAQQLFARYAMHKLLGRGGMGVVWLAQDEKLDRKVALKFLPEMLFLDAGARDELKRETRRSLELTHPNIVRIYDFVEDETMAAISMEYVDGWTFSRLLVQDGRQVFEPEEIEEWLGGLCGALDYAHLNARMVHRDLKPSNLMLNARREVKITDFGIACSLRSSVTRVSLCNSCGGTLAYMSPQQMQGDIPAPSDDIYSLGATLYEMITGKPPFYSGSVPLQVREIVPPAMTDRRAALGIQRKPISPQWESAIAACLAKDPADRPETAGEFLERVHGHARNTHPTRARMDARATRFGTLPPSRKTAGRAAFPKHYNPHRGDWGISHCHIGRSGSRLVSTAAFPARPGARRGKKRQSQPPPPATHHAWWISAQDVAPGSNGRAWRGSIGNVARDLQWNYSRQVSFEDYSSRL